MDVPEAAGPEWADEEGSPALDPDTEGEGPISRNSQRRACEVSVPFLMWTRVLRYSGDLDRSTMCHE